MPTLMPPVTELHAPVLAALWLELRERAPVERVGFLHVALVSAATRSFAVAAADLTSAIRPALSAAVTHAVVAAAATLTDVFGDGDVGVQALQDAWGAAADGPLPQRPRDGAPSAEGGDRQGRARLPMLACLRPDLPLDLRYQSLSVDAQLVLLALAGETGYARAVWEPDVIAIRTGPLASGAAESGLEMLADGGWMVRSDCGEAAAGRGRVIGVHPRVLLGIADGPWGRRAHRRSPRAVRPVR
jgi:hypothetical protein